jgi:ribosomal 30S subunit maturation factor RimM
VIDFIVEDEDLGLLGTIKEVVQSGPNRLLELDYLGKGSTDTG